jgi:putative PIN family toxin of toxin-antitoxin system
MRVVLDTNVLVSALIKGGKPRRLLKVLTDSRHKLIISEPIIEEFSRVTADEKIRKYVNDEDVAAFLGTLVIKAIFVPLESRVRVFNNADDDVLSTAKEGHTDLLITGDRHMLELKRFGRVRILTVGRAISTIKGAR